MAKITTKYSAMMVISTPVRALWVRCAAVWTIIPPWTAHMLPECLTADAKRSRRDPRISILPPSILEAHYCNWEWPPGNVPPRPVILPAEDAASKLTRRKSKPRSCVVGSQTFWETWVQDFAWVLEKTDAGARSLVRLV